MFFVLVLRLRLQKYSTNTKRYPPKKVFGNSEFCSSRQNHSRPNSLDQCCFSTCEPQSILRWATEHFGKSRILKKSCLNFFFFEFWWRPFFFWRSPAFGWKNRFNLLQIWFGRKIWVKLLSNTFRVGPWKNYQNGPRLEKRLGTTGLDFRELWFRREEQNSEFPKTFFGDIFLYLLNILATATPKLKQKISKIIVQF